VIMLIFKKTIVFVQSARETCGCTRRFRMCRGPPGSGPRVRRARPPRARGARRLKRTPGAHAGPCGLLLFGAVVGVCLTERALMPEKNEQKSAFSLAAV
jgi:hypothetical protein